ncbi:MoaB/Mog domain-containing protein [Multifurca ochricompacta]|uniref:MoaB/Mog domain-containing protein n=1 Tax=Multifurca ochricompacta TaxID=376703 RepID=A0AAD4M4H5_9AGAM|nr:MoaB/Mog domain-containing protein [Multifurca ochricompacta]
MPSTLRTSYRLFVLSRHFPSFATMSNKTGSSRAVADTPTSTTTSVPFSSGIDFELSPVPPNPLGKGRWIKTAGALIIGDEILNGKTLDRNSNYFARYCFENGIDLKRIEVVPDEEDEMCVCIYTLPDHCQVNICCLCFRIQASRRMVQKYDFVITSGGIGPTHDDITYESLAKAFHQPLVYHAETLRRMTEMSKQRQWVHTQNEEQRRARERMALFPANAETLFVAKDIWVPVVRLEGKLCIFPGIPILFQKMLDALKAFLPLPPPSERPFRHQVFTTLPESIIAPYLTELQNHVKEEGIRVGSYPLLMKGVYVSLIGQNEERIRELGKEVEVKIQGKVVSEKEIREAKGTTNL